MAWHMPFLLNVWGAEPARLRATISAVSLLIDVVLALGNSSIS
jgi:hypothetical protein